MSTPKKENKSDKEKATPVMPTDKVYAEIYDCGGNRRATVNATDDQALAIAIAVEQERQEVARPHMAPFGSKIVG